jgi:hypothetical protein
MNLITFGFNEKGTPVFLNEEPFQQVGTMYLMKAGKNSVVGITLDDNMVKLAKAPGKAKRGRKAGVEAAAVAPKKRGRKPKAAAAAEAAPKKRGRKPKAEASKPAPKKKAGRPKAAKTKAVKMKKVEQKPTEAV